MKCTIYSVGDKREIINLNSLTLPGINGELEILPGHAESFIRLGQGKISFNSSSSQTQEDAQENSVCYINEDIISIIL